MKECFIKIELSMFESMFYFLNMFGLVIKHQLCVIFIIFKWVGLQIIYEMF